MAKPVDVLMRAVKEYCFTTKAVILLIIKLKGLAIELPTVTVTYLLFLRHVKTVPSGSLHYTDPNTMSAGNVTFSS